MGKINRQIETLAHDLSSELSKQDAEIYLQSFIEEDLPRLREELDHEVISRKDMEKKIFDQFMGQLGTLNESFDKDKKDREKRAENFMQVLKRFSDNVTEDISVSREERYI